MSETDNEDRTEAPSEKRLREARERGDSPRSRELANVAVLGCATLALKFTGPHIGGASRDWMRKALQFEPGLLGQPERLPVHAAQQLLALLMPITPLIVAALLGCLLAPAAMGSLRFSGQALKTDLTRLSPMAGFKRMYGKESLADRMEGQAVRHGRHQASPDGNRGGRPSVAGGGCLNQMLPS